MNCRAVLASDIFAAIHKRVSLSGEIEFSVQNLLEMNALEKASVSEIPSAGLYERQGAERRRRGVEGCGIRDELNG